MSSTKCWRDQFRNEQLENENIQKWMPLKDKPQELHQQRNRPLLDSSSDGGSSDSNQELYKNKHKQSTAKAVGLDGRSMGGKKQKLKSCDSVMAVGVPKSSRKIVRSQLSGSARNEKNIKSGRLTDNTTSPTHLKGSSSNEDRSKELPEELDKESAKLAYQLLERSCRYVIDVRVLALRAQKCLENEVIMKIMTNPRNADKIINSLQLLMRLVEEN